MLREMKALEQSVAERNLELLSKFRSLRKRAAEQKAEASTSSTSSSRSSTRTGS